MYSISTKSLKFIVFILIVSMFLTINSIVVAYANAMPFYGLKPNKIVLRSEFYTSYPSSTDERKTNIKLAASKLNNCFIDVNGEFSFNLTVGERTEARGFKKAKIIIDGEFVDGVGGGVCQVSTTLYNAVLLAGLDIIEYHPHSLPVSYVAPSFDAMVNSGWADLKFVNNTNNPIIINALADDSTLTIKIYGEQLTEKYVRKSVVTGEILPPSDKIIDADSLEYEHLYEDEFMRIKYGKAGLTSEGYIMVMKDGKLSNVKKIRSDKYNPTRGVLVKGVKPRENLISQQEPLKLKFADS